jgi:hypothetical protein
MVEPRAWEREKQVAGPTVATLKKLFALSGNRCAFTDCKNPLFSETGTLIADVCHIAGERPTAKRYDPDQTDKERHGFQNLICMCVNHHRVIDDDPDAYTVSKLKEMKASHESRQKKEFTTKDETVEKIAIAMGGLATGTVLSEVVREIVGFIQSFGKEPNKRSPRKKLNAEEVIQRLGDALRFAPNGELNVSCYKAEANPIVDFFCSVFRRGGWKVIRHPPQYERSTDLDADFIFLIAKKYQASNASKAVDEVFNACGFVSKKVPHGWDGEGGTKIKSNGQKTITFGYTLVVV